MINEQLTMKWEASALSKYNKMLGLIPMFHRGITKEVVNIKSEENAKRRNSLQVEDQDIIRAFISEVPKPFFSLMIRIMDEVGFDYKPYLQSGMI